MLHGHKNILKRLDPWASVLRRRLYMIDDDVFLRPLNRLELQAELLLQGGKDGGREREIGIGIDRAGLRQPRAVCCLVWSIFQADVVQSRDPGLVQYVSIE